MCLQANFSYSDSINLNIIQHPIGVGHGLRIYVYAKNGSVFDSLQQVLIRFDDTIVVLDWFTFVILFA